MNPAKVRRHRLQRLTDLPNIGPAMARDFEKLGITTPQALRDADPFALYQRLCHATGTRQDPCVLDVFLSVTRFLDGDEARPWWAYTAERKAQYGI